MIDFPIARYDQGPNCDKPYLSGDNARVLGPLHMLTKTIQLHKGSTQTTTKDYNWMSQWSIVPVSFLLLLLHDYSFRAETK